MDNYSNDNTARRYRAHVSVVGTTQIHLRNPYIIGWWSALYAFYVGSYCKFKV